MKKYTGSLAIVAMALSGCNPSNAEPEQTQAQIPPPITIDVAEVNMKDVQTWHTFTTRLEAPQRVVLKSRVSGQIDSVLFTEGARVEQGQVLFSLDARPFKARVESLEAQLASATAALEHADREAKRAEQLLTKNAISTEEADRRSVALRQAIAGRDTTAAQLKSAKLELNFSQVEAPISGVVSSAVTTQGNYVSAGDTTLTTLVSDQQVYAYFDIDERTWNRSFSEVQAQDHVPVSLAQVASTTSVPGYVDFIDNEINPNTGTLRVRAVFEAQTHRLKPGGFARISINSGDAQKVAIVPERAIGTDLKNRFVLVVDENNTLQYRLVELGERYNAYRAITSGLGQGDRIAVNGPARVGPGMPITPNMVTLDFSQTQFVLNPEPATNTLLSAIQ